MKSRRQTIAFFLSLFLIPLLGFGCFRGVSDTFENSGEIDREAILADARESGLIMNEAEVTQMASAVIEKPISAQTISDISAYRGIPFDTWRSGALADVTGGGSFGLAHDRFESGRYTFVAKMGGLTEPAEDSFYEGWLVQRGETMHMISIGPSVIVEDQVFSVLMANEDLRSYDFFVLTLETNDGNPAPSKHILEGTLR